MCIRDRIEIRHATLITNNDNNEVIENAVVQIADGKIAYAGLSASAPTFHAERVIDARGNVVMPGFVNTHTQDVYKRQGKPDCFDHCVNRIHGDIIFAGKGGA